MKPVARKPVTWLGRIAVLSAVVPLVLWFAPPASAAAGASTPGATVIVNNPGQSPAGGDVQIALTAHSEESTVENPSCRPQDLTLECWGSLFLVLPGYGNLAAGGLEVHRVAVGDIACDDESGDDGGCGDHETGLAAPADPGTPVQAQVNGLAVVKWPGNTGLEVGTKLQLKFTLTDNGPARYGDQMVVQVNLFKPGPDKPLLYRSAPQTVQQVRIQLAGS
jgi:hypothetical protein